MIKPLQFSINELHRLGTLLQRDKNDVDKVLANLGTVEKTNGYGTFFLKPQNLLFKVVWIACKDSQVLSAGFGGPNLSLRLHDLVSFYKDVREGFNVYDEKYHYVFYLADSGSYTVKITCDKKILINGVFIEDFAINNLEIHLL